jgi:cytochrome c2
MMTKLLITIVVLAISTGISLALDITAGAIQFKKCAPCHDVGENAKNKIGQRSRIAFGRTQ